MSHEEQKISDLIDGGLLQEKRNHIKEFVKQWMDGHEPDTFTRNEHGVVLYSAGPTSLNLEALFESLLEDYLEDQY